MNDVLPIKKYGVEFWLLAIVVFLIVIKIGAVAMLYLKHVSPSPIQDPLEYRNLGINIINGNPFSLAQKPPYPPELLRTPFYPLFLAFSFLFDKTGYLAVFLQQVMLIASGLLIFKMAMRFLPSKKKWWPIFLIIFLFIHPRIWMYSLQTLSESLFIFLSVFAVFWLLYPLVLKNWHIAASALSFGAAILTRPAGLLWLPGIFLLIFGVAAAKKKLITLLIFFGVLALSVLPWLARNYKMVGEPILSSSSSYNYILGFAPASLPVTEKCLDKIFDEKGREGCVFYAYSVAGYKEIKNIQNSISQNVSLLAFLEKNAKGIIPFWSFTANNDVINIISGAFDNYSKTGFRLVTLRAFFSIYFSIFIFILIAAAVGIFYLFKKGYWHIGAGILTIVAANTFLNYGVSYGRHHLVLVPIILFTACFIFSENKNQRVIYDEHAKI